MEEPYCPNERRFGLASLVFFRREVMKETLSYDERRCLQMWFRQAIAKLELDEVTGVMLKEYPIEGEKQTSHHTVQTRKRTSRSRVKTHTA